MLSPGWGAAAAAAVLLQPSLVTAGRALHPRSGGSAALDDAVRRMVGPLTLLRASQARATGATGAAGLADDPVESRRAGYTAELSGGLDGFFEPRRDNCPWCGSTALSERLRTTDLAQFKPGRFVIEECDACGLLFQNPRLSIDGLNFYYRDFYDGLGAGGTQFLLRATSRPTGAGSSWSGGTPTRGRGWTSAPGTPTSAWWPAASSPRPPSTASTWGKSIEEAHRRRWIDRAYRGLFPDLVADLAGRYDLISMFHYLEHTGTRRRSCGPPAPCSSQAANNLLIEVPDPESRFGRAARCRYWLPWFQPQHQQFVSARQTCAPSWSPRDSRSSRSSAGGPINR